ncbi:hypothetical protein F4781DRAFT_187237 [Annulohypoxylon bovei var. microspora]|nr:hypothetical protein F4781DRAFT_187237 [Annulohypoxylon bovei var. microspora]
MFASVITVVVSALAASAVATDAVAPRETYGNWAGKEWSDACADTGCTSKFTIGGAKGYYKDAPAFSVHCHPTKEATWSPCDVVGATTPGSVVESAWMKASSDDMVKVSVSHAFNGADGPRYNATGTIEFKKGETSFNMPVDQVTAAL